MAKPAPRTLLRPLVSHTAPGMEAPNAASDLLQCSITSTGNRLFSTFKLNFPVCAPFFLLSSGHYRAESGPIAFSSLTRYLYTSPRPLS